MFSNMDANKDGAIDKAEMGKMMQGKCGASK
jgi:Ca2+-binding EF-hand superfamily protein